MTQKEFEDLLENACKIYLEKEKNKPKKEMEIEFSVPIRMHIL